MIFQRAFLLLALGLATTLCAQTITLDTFNGTGNPPVATGAVNATTSWNGNVTRNATSITVGGTAKDDNGWGATGLNIDASGASQVAVIAQRDTGNAAPSLVIQFEDVSLNTYTVSVSTNSFATGALTTVNIPLSWPTGFNVGRITGWSIGGGTAPPGLAAFRMTFDNLSLSGSAPPPTITAQPPDRAIGVGTGTTMSVTATGVGTLRYQWRKGSTAIDGATQATLSFANVTLAQTGSYFVDVSNNAGTTASNPAVLTVLDAQPTHRLAPGNTGYLAGGTVTISNTLTFGAGATQIRWHVLLPTGWSFASATGTNGATDPAAGAVSMIDWNWTTLPTSPLTFTYTLNVPVGSEQDQNITALVTYGQNGIAGDIVVKPDPLIVRNVLSRHSADVDGDYRINLSELTRVIELYNTRKGTVRSGAYDVASTLTEDGFVAAPSRDAVPATLTRYHSADSNRDGLISLIELTRVISLYNTRNGGLRTGQYHLDASTEDGFAPGP